MERYKRNHDMLSEIDMKILINSKVVILGLGGLGEYILEMLVRIGIGEITIIDFDKFDMSNLNRQIYSDEFVIGKFKVDVAKERAININSKVIINAFTKKIDKKNVIELIKGHSLVVDGLDDIASRFVVNNACEKLGITFIYGAISSWYGQVSTILPGEKTLGKIYAKNKEGDLKKGSPSFTPALVASIQVSEVIKYLLKKGSLLNGKLLLIDTLLQDYEIIEFE
ncbi:HesA/MoeB/ThiF family protein [Helicovermis profundi]|uniref:HesA/MoeB/ThiF family protein n=1 Tax=Helicovermis profundi TaxID=3065157 RepID=A0AAU9ECX8_9FIRM|nr:HesA/MoeB/ThiF family protein [Clostridia bacterium S502]